MSEDTTKDDADTVIDEFYRRREANEQKNPLRRRDDTNPLQRREHAGYMVPDSEAGDSVEAFKEQRRRVRVKNPLER